MVLARIWSFSGDRSRRRSTRDTIVGTLIAVRFRSIKLQRLCVLLWPVSRARANRYTSANRGHPDSYLEWLWLYGFQIMAGTNTPIPT
jgi:hypothetical protein